MCGARSPAHRSGRTALPGSSTAAAWLETMGPDRPEGKACKRVVPRYHNVRSRGRLLRGRCGCSSGVEHNLAKVGVGGSNPLARSKFPVDFNPLPMDGPEEGFVHWRGTGAKPIEQKIDRAHGVLQIGRIECGIELGGAVVARFVAELRCHFP